MSDKKEGSAIVRFFKSLIGFFLGRKKKDD